MDPRDAMSPDQLDALGRAFSDQLLACLDECARGRRGLFSDYVDDDTGEAAWPEPGLQRSSAQHTS